MGFSSLSTAGSAAEARPRWKRVLSWLIRYVLPWGITAWLLVWFFGRVDFHEVMAIIRRGCNFWWIGAMMLLTAVGLVIRGVRWDMQLMQVGVPRMPVIVDSCALFGAYALNLVFPRLGEAWRCLYVSKRQHCPFMVVVGTDFGDRTADLICVAFTLVLAAILTPVQMHRFFEHYGVGRAVAHLFSSLWFWCSLTAVVGGIWCVLHFLKGRPWVESLRTGLRRVWAGFVALFKVRPVGLYLWLTLGIWVCYFLQTYVCFFAFSFTEPLISEPGTAYGLLPGLVCLVFGSCSTIIPSNGGLGPWTIAIAFSLELFGLRPVDAAAFALMVWGMQSLMLVALGIFAAFYTRYERPRPALQPGNDGSSK